VGDFAKKMEGAGDDDRFRAAKEKHLQKRKKHQ
jgi:hypothetical protein